MMQATRILLVDDDPLILEVVRLTLERAGYEVQTASDGEEALELLTDPSHPLPHVIITDARMPRRTGPELLRQIETDPRFQGIRTVLMSSDALAGKNVLCHAFITKERMSLELIDTLIRLERAPRQVLRYRAALPHAAPNLVAGGAAGGGSSKSIDSIPVTAHASAACAG